MVYKGKETIAMRMLQLFTACLLAVIVFGFPAGLWAASCIDIDDIPMEVKSQPAPGLIMLCVDNSGSMLWSIMIPESSQGVYGSYEYVFPEAYGYGYTPLSNNVKMDWKTQWAGFNTMYYNPDVTYVPWPRWNLLSCCQNPPSDPNADPDNPRQHPMESGTTFNLNGTFYSYTGTGGGGGFQVIPDDVVESEGIIVDDLDTPPVTEFIVDDGDPGFDSYDANGKPWCSGSSSCYGNDYERIYPSTNPNRCWRGTPPFTAKYYVDLPETGTYQVYAGYYRYGSRNRNTQYRIYHTSGTTDVYVDQTQGSGCTEVYLGEFEFNAGDELRVRIRSTSSSKSVSTDYVKLVPTFPLGGTQNRVFTSTGPWQTYYNSKAYPSSANPNYLYTNSANTHFTATWTANDLDPTIAYAVAVRWVDGSNRSSNITYTIQHGSGTETVTVSQKDDGGQWNVLATDLYFPSGSGSVTLDHTPRGSSWDRASADAVAFIPMDVVAPQSGGTPVGSLNIINAHYFVHNDNGTFLVNLDGSIGYYRVDDQDGDDRVDPGELFELTQDQAAAAGIVTGRTYEEERQNFANWYQFYRRRFMTDIAAIGQVIDQMSGVYVGMFSFPERFKYQLEPVRVEINNQQYDETDLILCRLYTMPYPRSNTPMRQGLKKVGEYLEEGKYRQGHSIPFANDDTYPYFMADYGGECQQSFTILLTDGYWNGGGPNMANHDGDNNTDFDGPPFGDPYEDTLADTAMYFYERDLKPSLANFVPINPADQATHQHMVTYGVSFGVHGSIDPADYPDCPYGTCPTWPQPQRNDITTIDDLWHATINGRGLFISAANPEELVQALMDIKSDIEARLGSAAAVSTNSVQRQIGTNVYQGLYHSGKWMGDLLAMPIDPRTGEVQDPIWSAADRLDNMDWDQRVIITYNGTTGIPFRYGNLTQEQKDLLSPDPQTAQDLVRYLRGDRTLELNQGGPFRIRDSKMGDVVHSEPAYLDGTVYVGANDGMLHAFDAQTGDERFAYIPNVVFDHLAELADPGYSHKYYVDATPFPKETVPGYSYVVGALGKGGKGVYCLDVSNAASASETAAASIVKWEYADPMDYDLGYIMRRVFLVPTRAGWAVIFGNGYDSVNGEAVLYILDVNDGSVIRKIHTGVFGCNGLSEPAIIDPDADNNVDYIYAGDLYGNLWKFDLTSDNPSEWKVSFTDGSTPQPLFTAASPDGLSQPITTAPDVMRHCELNREGFIVIFGTGKFLGEADYGDFTTQSFYGIYDWSNDWIAAANDDLTADDDKYLGRLMPAPNRVLSNLSGNSDLPTGAQNATLLQQTVEYETAQYRVITANQIDYYDPADDTGSHVGWYFDLPTTGERCIRNPLIVNELAFMVSTIPTSSPCSAGGSSVLYILDACSGGRPEESQFDVNQDEEINSEDTISTPSGDIPPTGEKINKLVFEPVIIKDRMYLNDSTGAIQEREIREVPEGMTYWRQIDYGGTQEDENQY